MGKEKTPHLFRWAILEALKEADVLKPFVNHVN